jgi:hypothetical protein
VRAPWTHMWCMCVHHGRVRVRGLVRDVLAIIANYKLYITSK